jgi:hypothetical protein
MLNLFLCYRKRPACGFRTVMNKLSLHNRMQRAYQACSHKRDACGSGEKSKNVLIL